MLKIKLQKVTEDARMPIKGSEHAAAYDVYAHSITSDVNGKVKAAKNRMSPPFRITTFEIVYGQGIDKVKEIIELLN